MFYHLVLHLAFKTAYCHNHKWPEEWIKEAVDLLHANWELNFKPRDNGVSTTTLGGNDQMGISECATSVNVVNIVVRAHCSINIAILSCCQWVWHHMMHLMLILHHQQ
jgi:hypothetical protein